MTIVSELSNTLITRGVCFVLSLFSSTFPVLHIVLSSVLHIREVDRKVVVFYRQQPRLSTWTPLLQRRGVLVHNNFFLI